MNLKTCAACVLMCLPGLSAWAAEEDVIVIEMDGNDFASSSAGPTVSVWQNSAAQLEKLFLSVKWSSGNYPERLKKALGSYDCVISAWDDDRLIGLVAAMDDGEMTAYIHYLLVAPDRQGQGVGKKLLAMTLERYRGYVRVVLHAEGKAASFYRPLGFEEMDAVSMCYVPAEGK